MPVIRIAKTLTYLFTALLAAAVAAPAAWAEGDGPEFHSNALKYRESEHAKPARGRSGSAELYLRALLGKEDAAGTKATDIEARTNDFENPTLPPGKITKILLKAFNGEGGLKFTKNYNNLGFDGGSFATGFTNLERGEKVEVQGNIRDIDRKRTDLVTLDTTVKLRPDLTVTEIGAPDTAYVGSLVNISGTVVEKNGDVGARANCLLSVDDTKVDSAPDIWIDAGGNVSCAFSHTFDKVGTYTVKVLADDVQPGDYDGDNNSASVVIKIIEPEEQPLEERPFWFMAYVSDFEYGSYYDSEGTYRYKDHSNVQYQGTWLDNRYDGRGTWTSTGAGKWDYTSLYRGRYQHLGFSGWTPDRWAFPIDKVSVALSLDGETKHSMTFTNLSAGSTWSYTYPDRPISFTSTCAWRWKDYQWLYLCTYKYQWYSSVWSGSSINYGRYAGEVTYHSEGWYQFWGRGNFNYQWQWGDEKYSDSGHYTWNYNWSGTSDYQGTWGTLLALAPGSVLGFEVRVIDDGRLYHGEPMITLQQLGNCTSGLYWWWWDCSGTWEQPWTCYSYDYSEKDNEKWWSWSGESVHYNYRYSSSGYGCYEYSSFHKGFFGWAFGRSGPLR